LTINMRRRQRGYARSCYGYYSSLILCVIAVHPNQPQINQNRAKPGQAPAKFSQRKKLGFPWISLSELRLFNGLSRPPSQKILFFLLSPLLAVRQWRASSSGLNQNTMLSDFRKTNPRDPVIPAPLKAIPSRRVML
jgi:hypothetical protein